MQLSIEPGTYVVAVSGGVDSVVLLDILCQQSDLKLIVAHYDHGIRKDSAADRHLVEEIARANRLPFEHAEGNLGVGASEELARTKRYEFLYAIRAKHRARAIITAHHQDDVLETVIINLLRGTGRKGLSSLQSSDELVRPMLHLPKAELISTARARSLQWNEDESNSDQTYLRNWVRHTIIPKLTPEQRDELLAKQKLALENNQAIDHLLDAYIDAGDAGSLNRQDITELPHAVAVELIAHWLRTNEIREVDKKMLERITLGAKTLRPGKTIAVKGKAVIKVATQKIQLLKL